MNQTELNTHPENMTTIINIQTMQRVIGIKESKIEYLENIPHDKLFFIQNELIPLYNNFLQEN